MDVVLGAMLQSHTIRINPEVLSLIADTDEFKDAWRALVEWEHLSPDGSGRGVWYELR